VRRATREGKGRSPGVRVRARRRSGEELLELARLVQGLEVRVAADVLAADEDRGDGALPSLVAEVGLPVGAVLLQIELVQVEVLALLLKEGLGASAMRAVTLGEDDDTLARGDGGFCGRGSSARPWERRGAKEDGPTASLAAMLSVLGGGVGWSEGREGERGARSREAGPGDDESCRPSESRWRYVTTRAMRGRAHRKDRRARSLGRLIQRREREQEPPPLVPTRRADHSHRLPLPSLTATARSATGWLSSSLDRPPSATTSEPTHTRDRRRRRPLAAASSSPAHESALGCTADMDPERAGAPTPRTHPPPPPTDYAKVDQLVQVRLLPLPSSSSSRSPPPRGSS